MLCKIDMKDDCIAIWDPKLSNLQRNIAISIFRLSSIYWEWLSTELKDAMSIIRSLNSHNDVGCNSQAGCKCKCQNELFFIPSFLKRKRWNEMKVCYKKHTEKHNWNTSAVLHFVVSFFFFFFSFEMWNYYPHG